MTRLPEAFLPLHDSDVKRLTKLDAYKPGFGRMSITGWSYHLGTFPGLSVFAEAGNRMGTARRCNLARLFLILRQDLQRPVIYQPEGVQILTRVSESVLFNCHFPHPFELAPKTPDVLPHSHLANHFSKAIEEIEQIIKGRLYVALILPGDFIKELKRAGLLK